MQFSLMDAKPLCRWICFKASRWSGFGCLEYMSMVLFWNMIFGTPTCDSCSRVKVDGFVLRLDTRNSYVWILVSGICRWFCFKTLYSELLRVIFGLGFMSMVLFWDMAFEISTCDFLGLCTRRWFCFEAIVSHHLEPFRQLLRFFWFLDFGFWISNEADFQFWWLIFSGYPIPGCALLLAGSLPRRLKWPREKKEHPRQRHIIRLGP